MRKYKYGEDYRAYNEEIAEKLYNMRICGIPLSLYILDLRKTNTYCHISSDYLAYCIKGSNRVEGTIDSIIGENKRHSWVEKGDLVYDTTNGLVWKKSSYYERLRPHDCIIIPNEQILQEIGKYLDGENMNEMYIAWIQDIMENIDKCPYRAVLQQHIARFKKEKDLDNKEIDQCLLKEYLEEMKRIYSKIDRFIEEAESER